MMESSDTDKPDSVVVGLTDEEYDSLFPNAEVISLGPAPEPEPSIPVDEIVDAIEATFGTRPDRRIGVPTGFPNFDMRTRGLHNGLEAMAQQTQCPVLLISQANRGAAISDERPKMHHLKHSGSFEEYAHCFLMLEYGNDDDIWIDKNRHGRVGSLNARFHGEAHTWEVTDG